MVVETKIRIEKIIDTSYLVQLAQCMPIIIFHSSSDRFPRSDMVHRTENSRETNTNQRFVTSSENMKKAICEFSPVDFGSMENFCNFPKVSYF